MALSPLSKVAPLIGTVAAASAVCYYIQRGIWPLGRTLNNEWFVASEKYMMANPRQGSDKPSRMNPFSEKINMHSVTY